jgi:hypothetical protein
MNGVFGISHNALNIVKDKIGIGTNMPEGRFHFEEVLDSLNAPDFVGVGFPNERGIKFFGPRTPSINANSTAPIEFTNRLTEAQTQTWRIVMVSGLLRFSFGSGANDTNYMRTAASYFVMSNSSANFAGSLTGATQIQCIGGSVLGTTTYKLTNAGGTVTPRIMLGNNATTTGVMRLAYDDTNQLLFLAGNASSVLTARAGIGIAALTNTAAAEAGDMIFLTQSAGAAMAERVRIGSNGTLSGTGQARFGITSGSSTIIDLYTTNGGGAVTTGLLLVGRGLTFSAGVQTLQYEDTTNRLHFAASNGSKHISRAAIGIDGLGNSAGSEYASLCFYTKPTGAGIAERWRISYDGCFNNMATQVSAHIGLGGSTTSLGLIFINSDAVLMSTPTPGTIDSDTNFIYYTTPNSERLQIPLVLNAVLNDSDFSVTSSTTLSNINELSAPIVAGSKYKFEAHIFVRADAGGFKLQLNGSATASEFIETVITSITSTSATSSINSTLGSLTTTEGSAGDYHITARGYVECSADGNLIYKFAQNSSNGTPSLVLVGSYLTLENIV